MMLQSPLFRENRFRREDVFWPWRRTLPDLGLLSPVGQLFRQPTLFAKWSRCIGPNGTKKRSRHERRFQGQQITVQCVAIRLGMNLLRQFITELFELPGISLSNKSLRFVVVVLSNS